MNGRTASSKGLAGRRMLVVEDDYLIASQMAEELQERGAEVIGPAGSIADAIALVETAGPIDGAVVDFSLHGEFATPVAQALLNRNVPFVFATGYDPWVIPRRFRHVVVCEKPVDLAKVTRALFAGGSCS